MPAIDNESKIVRTEDMEDEEEKIELLRDEQDGRNL